VLLLLVLLAAPDTHELRYRFEKGMSYDETTTRSFDFASGEGKEKQRLASSSIETLRRTVLETDETNHPTIERIEVLRFSQPVISSRPDDPGTVADPSEGKTFVWRRLEERWGLFDGKSDVTERHPRLVERLKNWRDARLPKAPVAVGATWEVSARTYLETAGLPVPSEIEGVSVHKLERVEGEVATISFRFVARAVLDGAAQEWDQTGTIRFDLARGRDLEWTAEGSVKVAGKEGGEGTFKMSRKVTYR